MSVHSEEGEVTKSGSTWSSCRGKRGDVDGRRGTRGLTPEKTIQPLPSTHSLQDGEGSSDLRMGRDLQLNLAFFYKPVGGALIKCH